MRVAVRAARRFVITSYSIHYTKLYDFWEWKGKLAADNPWWKGVSPEMITLMGAKVHPGAAKYYREAGVKLPDSMK